jgi:serine protease Do
VGATPAIDVDLARVAERVRRSTVEVHGAGGGGSGVVWSADGLIVTNAHVVRQPVRVVDQDRRVFPARVVGWDPERDLAALAVDGGERLLAASKGDPDTLRVGDLVVAVGHPGGVVGAVTVGVVHAIVEHGGPPRRRFIQADLRLAPGNSGGPLADARGRVVGVNSMIAGGLAVAITAGTVAVLLAGLRPWGPIRT